MSDKRNTIAYIFSRYKVAILIILSIIAISTIAVIAFSINNSINEDKGIAVEFANEEFKDTVELSLDDDYLTTKDIENLSVLKLNNVNLDGKLEDLRWFTNLKELYINNCQISSLENIELPPQLQVFDVSYNNISKLIVPKQINGSNTIKKIIANGNPIVDIDTKSLGVSSISELNLQNCDLVGNIDFGENIQIERLILDDNAITSIEGTLQNLNYLSVKNNDFTSISSLLKYNKLIELYMTGNYLNNISGIEQLSNLETIDIRENMITEVHELKNLNKLSSVYMDYGIDRRSLEFMSDHWRNGDVETKKYFLQRKYNLDVR